MARISLSRDIIHAGNPSLFHRLRRELVAIFWRNGGSWRINRNCSCRRRFGRFADHRLGDGSEHGKILRQVASNVHCQGILQTRPCAPNKFRPDTRARSTCAHARRCKSQPAKCFAPGVTAQVFPRLQFEKDTSGPFRASLIRAVRKKCRELDLALSHRHASQRWPGRSRGPTLAGGRRGWRFACLRRSSRSALRAARARASGALAAGSRRGRGA